MMKTSMLMISFQASPGQSNKRLGHTKLLCSPPEGITLNQGEKMSLIQKFEYDRNHPLDIRHAGTQKEDEFTIQNLTFSTPFGYRRAAYLLSPGEEQPRAAILFVHWLETWDPTANRRQFLDEAKHLAAKGATCLLVETMWSDQDWFIKRSQAQDIQNSIQQVIELRLAFDLLLSQSLVDPTRFAYVGHDFGGMYGVLAGSIDSRPSCYVIMSATPRFSDWFLYYPPLEEPDRSKFITEMTPFDPISRVAELAPAPILFQFADDDFHVPQPRAEEFYAAAQQPKELRWYQAKHGLNQTASEERVLWLTEKLRLD
jgi:dienelactone hydrolase